MKVHLTGGKGFLGQYAVKELTSYEVEISDIDTLDVTDLQATIDHFAASKPDIVVHLAGLTGANKSIENPWKFFDVGCTGTLNVLEACRRAEIPGFVFLSSLTVHGQTEGEVVDESSLLAPRHPYAGAKAAAEYVVQTYARCYGMRAAILRPTLISGEGQNEPNAVTEFADTVRQGEAIDIFGDGSHKREWLHPADVGTSIRAAVDFVADPDHRGCETFIISSGQPVSMADIAKKVIAQLGRGELTFTPSNRQAFDLCTAPGKAREQLGWSPELSIDEIIRRTLATDA